MYDVHSKSWGLGRSSAAQTHVLEIALPLAHSADEAIQRSVAGRAGGVLAIFSNMPPHVCPRQVAGGPRRGFLPQVQAPNWLLKHASVPPRCCGQRLELTEGMSPRGIPCHCTDKAGNIYSTLACICRVALLLLKQSCHRLFLKQFSFKRCCRQSVCAAKRPAQHVPPVAARETAAASSHARAGIVQVRGRPVPSPRRRAPSTSWERKKSAFFCFGTPVAGCIQGCSHSGELARHVLAHVMNSVVKRDVEGE
jgi:hypothetical protein